MINTLEEFKTFLDSKLKESEEEIILVASYNGGNDNGEIEFAHSEVTDDSYIIQMFLSNSLGYGSWAGEFEAYGDVYYDGKQFSVEGYESVYVDPEIKNFEF